MRANFAFVREGTSDDGLLPHFRELLIRFGLEEASGAARDYRGSVLDCLRSVIDEESEVDIIFVHRDTDSPSDVEVRREISEAVGALSSSLSAVVVPVVPIQELEAWLLLDETAIRTVVGKPSGTMSLNLPRHSQIEGTSSPKEILQSALLRASDTSGRRYKEEKRRFSERRRTLLERLDIDGPIRNLSAWAALERDLGDAVARLLA